MAKPTLIAYKPQDFSHLNGLNGISDDQLKAHFELYQGYVKNTNALNEQIADLLRSGKPDSPDYLELMRALGFEYNGMILHEYYFGNLMPNGSERTRKGQLDQMIIRDFGTWDAWRSAFINVGKMRGIGWAILYQDPVTERLSNHWISLHENGHPAGFKPLLVMDVWEHAFVPDYKPTDRASYIEAFFSNVAWEAVEQRLQNPAAERRSAA
jgi:Fe-Mn family superoxide dismutase